MALRRDEKPYKTRRIERFCDTLFYPQGASARSDETFIRSDETFIDETFIDETFIDETFINEGFIESDETFIAEGSFMKPSSGLCRMYRILRVPVWENDPLARTLENP